MNEEQLKAQALKNMEIGIQEVINGQIKEFESGLICMNDIDEHIKSIGGEKFGDFDTNGWQYDCWQNYKIEGIIYSVFGNGYFGGVRFLLDEDYE